MPLYEYECDKCGHRAEVIQRVGAPPIGPCERCGGEMKRLLSAPAFQFKGSGWYVTDYAQKSGAAGASSGEPKPDKASEKSTPAAPAKESSGTDSKKTD